MHHPARCALPVVGSVMLLALATACRDRAGDASAADAAAARPRLAVVTAERTDLLFRYRAEDGSFVTATKIDEIPAAAREAVQVVDLSLSPEERAAAEYVQVFDLRRPRDDGRFPGRLVPRDQLERALAERSARPPQAEVTMYSASWCGVCRKARRFLQDEGIAFVEKDIEKDPGAAEELQRKARAAGVPVSGVPVFDVGGRLLGGFDPEALRRAVRSSGG